MGRITKMKTPTATELNLAMCEWMGWTGIAPYHGDGPLWGKDANGRLFQLPDYLSDDSPRRLLNEAEARLTIYQKMEYRDLLATNESEICDWSLISATARQRCIAILQVVKPELFR